jgi:L-amino acid N-acyltransferase YncA
MFRDRRSATLCRQRAIPLARLHDAYVNEDLERGLEIRDAVEDDWHAIWPFLREIVRAGDTYTWRTDVTEPEARDRWLRPAPWRTLVAVDTDGNAVGTARVGPNQDGPGSHVANASFMVDPTRTGAGIGRALAVHIIEAAPAAGYRAMQFNAVVESNTRAVRLWQSLGFDILATVPEAFHHPAEGFVGLHIMYLRL